MKIAFMSSILMPKDLMIWPSYVVASGYDRSITIDAEEVDEEEGVPYL